MDMVRQRERGDWTLACPEVGQYGDDFLGCGREAWLTSKQGLLIIRGLGYGGLYAEEVGHGDVTD